VQLLETAPASPLKISLPLWLNKILFRHGMPLVGAKTGIQALLAILATFIIYLYTLWPTVMLSLTVAALLLFLVLLGLYQDQRYEDQREGMANVSWEGIPIKTSVFVKIALMKIFFRAYIFAVSVLVVAGILIGTLYYMDSMISWVKKTIFPQAVTQSEQEKKAPPENAPPEKAAPPILKPKQPEPDFKIKEPTLPWPPRG
jgi:hypothetical protein